MEVMPEIRMGTNSDIDVLLVDSRFDNPGHDKLVGKIWRFTYTFGARIKPYTIGNQKVNMDEGDSLIEIVKQGGIEIRA